MGKVTQEDRAEAVEFVEGSILTAVEKGMNGEERCLRDLLAVLNAGIAAQETLDAIETHRVGPQDQGGAAMSDAQERPSRERCAIACACAGTVDVLRMIDAETHRMMEPAAAYLREDADLAERLRAAEAERDALAAQVASVKCCETCAGGDPQPMADDCLCEWSDECHPTDGGPRFCHWRPASQEQLAERGREADNADPKRYGRAVLCMTGHYVERRDERDAARRALASCRKALRFLVEAPLCMWRDPKLGWVFCRGTSTDLLSSLAAAADVPLADLAETEPAPIAGTLPTVMHDPGPPATVGRVLSGHTDAEGSK